MTLAFSTKFPEGKGSISGKPTYFIEKIWECVVEQNFKYKETDVFKRILYFRESEISKGRKTNSKKHTIRRDENERWNEGKLIHPVINNRTPQRFQFAPTFSCTGKERIIVIHPDNKSKSFKPFVQIDGEDIFQDDPRMEQLAINDGFDSVDDFFCWFDEYFEGWIIHWTDVRYSVKNKKVVDPIIEKKDLSMKKYLNVKKYG